MRLNFEYSNLNLETKYDENTHHMRLIKDNYFVNPSLAQYDESTKNNIEMKFLAFMKHLFQDKPIVSANLINIHLGNINSELIFKVIIDNY